MPLVLDGTNGVSGVDGTASNPSLEGTDSNTGVFFPAADTVAIATGGSERLRVDSSGNVGIGTSSPADNLAVYDSGTDSRIYLQSSSTGTTNADGLMLGSLAGQGYVYNYENQPLVFGTNATERARFNAGAPILCLSGGNTSATGTGIAFPATHSASSDANTLDDYEEGTWTPSLSSTGASFTYPRGQYGMYVKVGQLVFAQFYIGASATGTTSNSCSISGLPFTSNNLNILAQSSVSAWVDQTTSLGFTVDVNNTTIAIWRQNVGGASLATAAQVAGGYIVGHAMYRTGS
jgi:hypothetical protein